MSETALRIASIPLTPSPYWGRPFCGRVPKSLVSGCRPLFLIVCLTVGPHTDRGRDHNVSDRIVASSSLANESNRASYARDL